MIVRRARKNSGGAALDGAVLLTGMPGRLGLLENGDVLPDGMRFSEFVRAAGVERQPPLAPTLQLTGSGGKSLEIGTTISPELQASFNQRQGGAATALRWKRAGALLVPEIADPADVETYTDAGHQLTEHTTYRAEVDYAEGAEIDNATTIGQVAGGMSADEVTYYARRASWHGFPAATPATSADVRALPNQVLGRDNGDTFDIAIPGGATRVVIAYPAALGALSSVQYVEGSNAEVKANFALAGGGTINVEGAEGFGGVPYNVYFYEPVEPFPGDANATAATYRVTI